MLIGSVVGLFSVVIFGVFILSEIDRDIKEGMNDQS
jgi:hypothetical protein